MNSSNSNVKRKNLLPRFITASILIHLILFAFLAHDYLKKEAIKKALQERDEYIEITDIPIPKEKETEPPEKTKRLANRSHKTEKETTRDDITKLAKQKKVISPKVAPQPKPKKSSPTKKAETVKKAENDKLKK